MKIDSVRSLRIVLDEKEMDTILIALEQSFDRGGTFGALCGEMSAEIREGISEMHQQGS